MSIRSYLYVPGDRLDRLAKVFTRGADAVIADLEDAVSHQAKATARQTVAQWLAGLGNPPVPVWVRVNPGPELKLDVAAVAGEPALTGVVLAKADSAAQLLELDRMLTAMGSAAQVAPLLESAAALLAASAIATAPRVMALHLGEVDLCADLDLDPLPEEEELRYARFLVMVAARAAGIAPVAPVSVDFADSERFRRSTHALRRMGFYGRACIHPAQVGVANEAFAPTEEQVRWARDVLSRSAAAAGSGAVRDGAGQMIDEAVLRRARRILASGSTPA